MELSIGKVISGLRKKNGVTQEQLADAVGVSVPAVSKWETGNSYPDITLLIPVARYLGVTVDELLHYEYDIPPERVLEIEKECAEKFEAEGYDTGLSLCEDALKEYPNNLYLKFRIGALLPWYAAKCGTDEKTAHTAIEKAAGLLGQACRSEEDKIRNASLYLLACTYLQMDQSQEARDLLEKMPSGEPDPSRILPTVYLQQGEPEEAEKLDQQNLFRDLNNAAMALTSLAGIAMREKKWEEALRYADAQRQLLEIFFREDFLMASNYQLYATVFARRKDPENTLRYLERYLSDFPYDAGRFRFSDNFFFQRAETKHFSVALNFTKDTMIRALEENRNLDFLRGDVRFQELLEAFRSEAPPAL